MRIKKALPMPAAEHTTRGGFLLGCEPQQYAGLLEAGQVWLLQVKGTAVGFAAALTNAMLRASPLWHTRDAIDWDASFDPQPWLGKRIGFFDQLAVLPSVRYRYWGAALALRALLSLTEDDRDELVLTTTVVAPIVNAAALPFLVRVGAQAVGRLVEHNTPRGTIVSAVHAIHVDRFREAMVRRRGKLQPAALRVVEAVWP
ncbi:MAG: hypothetical protein SF187_02895 [Deltaproteobacteria bacterium]|nr:hypothetical protein [Deltaproteobacteria bacterium]